MLLVLALPIVAGAQANPAGTVRPRVTERVDISRLTTLKGNTYRLARTQFDQGAAPADLPMNRIMLVLQRSPDQEAALQDLLNQQQINNSPNFHKWLTPDQFGQQFGPADADIQAVTSWLASFGFQNIQVSKGRVTIEFSGTAAQVQAALHTPIHRYVVNGESHWANANDPQIPSALAPVVAGFASLNDFRHLPTLKISSQKVSGAAQPGERPQINFSGGSHGLVPADFDKIYNVTASGMTGAGRSIGIVADTNISLQDITDFRNMFGAPNGPPNIILNGPDPGDVPGSSAEGEAVLDVTWAGSVAPAATVDLVVSEDTNASQGSDLSEFYIINNNLTDVMTESFSTCELQYAQAGFLSGANGAGLFYGSLAEQAAAQGITFLVSSGDGGPDTCDDPGTNPAVPAPASVNLLAATPFNTAVGGTEFHDCDPMPFCVDNSANSPYWQSANGTNSESAKGYIPESVWNEQCTVAQCGVNNAGIWSSGGGASIEFGASSDYPTTPPWQTGVTGLPTGAHPRLLPDVALNAADHDGYVLCIDQSCEGNCPPQVAPGPPCFGVASGTSASVQAFGGIVALLDQKVGGRIGNANYGLYKLAHNESYGSCNGSAVPTPGSLSSCVFNDVTAGDTNIPGETGFSANVPGYDEATGLGSVNVANLLSKWSSAVSTGSTVTLSLNRGTSTFTVPHGTAVSVGSVVSASPTAASPAPTGDISLIANTTNVPGTSSGQGVDFFQLTPSGNTGVVSSGLNSTIWLPGGTYPVHAHYSGDGTYVGSDSTPITVTVTPEPSKIAGGLIVTDANGACASPSTAAWGSGYVIGVVVSDLNVAATPCSPNETGASPTGTVTLSDSVSGSGGVSGPFQLNSGGWFEVQGLQLAVGTHKITASYGGDSSFTASSTGASAPAAIFTVTITPGVQVAPCSGATVTVAAPGQSGTCAITVSGPSGSSENVTLSAAVTGSPSGAVNPPSCNAFSPSSMIALTSSNTSGSATMTCSTTAASGVLVRPSSRPSGRGLPLAGLATALMGLLFIVATRRERRWSLVPLTALLAVVVLTAVSCGSSGTPLPGTHAGTTAGTYTVTVTATPSSGSAQTTTVSVVVQ